MWSTLLGLPFHLEDRTALNTRRGGCYVSRPDPLSEASVLPVMIGETLAALVGSCHWCANCTTLGVYTLFSPLTDGH
jgi:hypothetical protein